MDPERGARCSTYERSKEASMRYLIALAAVTATLAGAGAAHAGGWATVGLGSLPTGLDKGDTWRADITVLRHGRTPTDGAAPAVTIRNTKTGQKLTFPAKPTGKTGKYEARVVFPTSGTWRYEIDNGLRATGYGESATTTYAPVTIGPGGSSVPLWPFAMVGIALAGAGAFAFRRHRAIPVPTH
jgi:YtkA-like protein